MVGSVHDESGGPARRGHAEPRVEPVHRGRTEEASLRAADPRIAPHTRHRPGIIGGHRIGGRRRVLVAHHRGAAPLQPHLPEHRVARERGVVAAVEHELLDRIPPGGRPVLVVPGADHEPVTVGQALDLLEVARDRVVELETGPLRPLGEAPVVGEPAGRAHVAGEPVGEAERLIRLAVDIGLLARAARRRLAGRRARPQVARACPDPRGAGTRPRALPCRGSGRPSCCRRSTCWWRARTAPVQSASRRAPRSRHIRSPGRRARMGGHRDEIEAAPPPGLGGDVERRVPTAAGGIRIGRRRLQHSTHVVRRPHEIERATPPVHAHVEPLGARRHAELGDAACDATR